MIWGTLSFALPVIDPENDLVEAEVEVEIGNSRSENFLKIALIEFLIDQHAICCEKFRRKSAKGR